MMTITASFHHAIDRILTTEFLNDIILKNIYDRYMKLIPINTNLDGMDCHLHSPFSPDAKACGADEPDKIAAVCIERGLRGFIITDHLDIGHWNGYIPDFKNYFDVWNRVRNNVELTVYIGLEVGYEKKYAKETAKLIKNLPLEYVINSVHYWDGPVACDPRDHYSLGRKKSYDAYLDAVLSSLDAPYEFSAIGHLGFVERYAPYDNTDVAMSYDMFGEKLERIMEKAIKRGVRFEENTNSVGEIRQPRADFLKAYKAAGGIKPMLGSDAHRSESIGQNFSSAQSFLADIFD